MDMTLMSMIVASVMIVTACAMVMMVVMGVARARLRRNQRRRIAKLGDPFLDLARTRSGFVKNERERFVGHGKRDAGDAGKPLEGAANGGGAAAAIHARYFPGHRGRGGLLRGMVSILRAVVVAMGAAVRAVDVVVVCQSVIVGGFHPIPRKVHQVAG